MIVRLKKALGHALIGSSRQIKLAQDDVSPDGE